MLFLHDDVIIWKHFPRYWSFVRRIHRSPVNSPHKDQWRGALMFSLICAWINVWVNDLEAGDLRRHRARYIVTVMSNDLLSKSKSKKTLFKVGPCKQTTLAFTWSKCSVTMDHFSICRKELQWNLNPIATILNAFEMSLASLCPLCHGRLC